MKKASLIILFIIATYSVNAQSIGGLWQGKWTSPDGFVFDFVLHIDEFPNGDMEGYLIWKFISAPEGDWYYTGKQDMEATEFVKGKIPEKGKLDFEGYKKDDPNLIIALDKYKLVFDETFNSFTGITGNHGSWAAKIEGIRIGLP